MARGGKLSQPGCVGGKQSLRKGVLAGHPWSDRAHLA